MAGSGGATADGVSTGGSGDATATGGVAGSAGAAEGGGTAATGLGNSTVETCERCATDSGVTKRGARSTTGGAGLAATGLLTIALGGAGGGATGGRDETTVSALGSLRARMALSASPGLEIFERSILGRNSSPPLRWRLAVPLVSWKYLRTFSASSTSTELEWVFFSVTPTLISTSRICLLFTSSSRARSLIRIFIRRSFPHA